MKSATNDFCSSPACLSWNLQVSVWKMWALLAGKEASGHFVLEDVKDNLIIKYAEKCSLAAYQICGCIRLSHCASVSPSNIKSVSSAHRKVVKLNVMFV